MPLTVNEGTQTNIYSIENAGTEIPYVKLDAGVGSAVLDWGGTIPTVDNLNNGTVRISVGTVATGTIQNLASGTINSGTTESLNIGRRHADEFATVVTSGTSTLGTIRGSVLGSAIYVTNIVVSVGSASNVTIASGGTSTAIGGTFFLSANGGFVNGPIDPPWRTASGSALVFQQSANGPISITATGYID